MLDWKAILMLVLTGIGLIQTYWVYIKNQKLKMADRLRTADLLRVSVVESDLASHIREDKEMAERVQKTETRLEGIQQQVNDVNSRHGDLVARIDDVHRNMMTKEDFRNLVDVIKTLGR